MNTPSNPSASTNSRELFRVPVIPKSGLSGAVRFADQDSHGVKVCDVSEAGVKVEFATENPPNVSVGMRVEFDVLYRDESILMKGVVSRLADDHVVIVFAQATDDEGRRNAGRWREVAPSIQQLWLKYRLQ